MKKLFRLKYLLLAVIVLFGLLFISAENSTKAGFNCSYTQSNNKIPEGTSDQACIDKYYACQDNNKEIRTEWGTCSGWGGAPDTLGCHAHTREAWLINPTLCPADYKTNTRFQDDQFWGTSNRIYCECVEACGPEPIATDCWPTLENCCATLVEEEEPEPEVIVPEPEVKIEEPKTTTTVPTDKPEVKSPIDCPINSTYKSDRCVCDSGYTTNPQETCCAQELSAAARLTKIQNLYYKNIPKGITTSGKLNNIYSIFNSKYEKYACGGYQSMVLEFLDNLKYSDDCDTSALLEGFDYGPIEAYFKWHQAVVIYPSGTDWVQTGLALDPWPNQKPEIYTMNDWGIKFSGSSFWGISGSSVYDDGYPTIGGDYKDPAVYNVDSKAVKNFLNTLSGAKHAQFKNLSAYEKRAYVLWLDKKSKIRVHVHSPVKLIITDSKNNKIGENTSGDFYDEADGIYIRTEEMEDGHYSYDLYMSTGEYKLALTGNDNGKVQVVTAMYSDKSNSFTAQQGNINIKKGAKANITISSQQKSITSSDIKFSKVSNTQDVKNIPTTKQTALAGSLSGWHDQNWDQYDDDESGSGMWMWILYIAGAFIFIGAVILSIILLVFKKKFIIVLLIFAIIMLFSCSLSGVATYLLIDGWDSNSNVTKSLDPNISDDEVDTYIDTNDDATTTIPTTNDVSDEKESEPATIDYAAQGLILNKDYNFTLDVGEKYVKKFRVQENVNEGFVTDSYAYCYNTSDKYSDDVYCKSGEISLFTVDVMTQQQWSDMFTDDYSLTPFDMGYQVMTDRGGMIYAYSHINGLLPDDAPSGNDYYEVVPTSIKFVK